MLKRGFKISVWFVVLNFVSTHIWTEPVWYWWLILGVNFIIACLMIEDQICANCTNLFFVQNYYLTNELKSVIMPAARAIGEARFPLYHSPQVLSIGKLHKFSILADPGIVQIYQRTCVNRQSVQTSARIFVHFVYCIFGTICYNSKCQGEIATEHRPRGNRKKVKKPLDNLQ